MAARATVKPMTLRILKDEKRNKVVCAHAGKDFVDILLSFLTFPLGTIVRLVGKESDMKKVKVGSLNTLYESVANLGVEHFWTETCKEMLLQPRNSMEAYCHSLNLNIDDTNRMKFFLCQDLECAHTKPSSLPNISKNQKCKCGKLMNQEIFPQNHVCINYKGFVQDWDSFIIFDNLKVIPENIQNCVSLPKTLGYEDFNAFKADTVVIETRQEVLDLLKCCLVSDTPLTDYFLMKKKVHENAQPNSSLLFNTIGDTEDNVRDDLIKLKIVITKSEMKVLFAVAEADFVDILLSFLTLPLGGVEYMLKGNTCLGSIDNLYKSVVELDTHKYFQSPSLKDKFVKTPLPYQFKHQKQILPIDEGSLPDYVISYLKTFISSSFSHAHYSTIGTSGSGKGFVKSNSGFVKSNSLYMITDDLIVTRTSSISLASFLSMSNISPSDVEEKIISIDKKKCLSLLKASLISSSAVTNGLGQFLYPIKAEKISN